LVVAVAVAVAVGIGADVGVTEDLGAIEDEAVGSIVLGEVESPEQPCNTRLAITVLVPIAMPLAIPKKFAEIDLFVMTYHTPVT
jgi:hypothetical protein